MWSFHPQIKFRLRGTFIADELPLSQDVKPSQPLCILRNSYLSSISSSSFFLPEVSVNAFVCQECDNQLDVITEHFNIEKKLRICETVVFISDLESALPCLIFLMHSEVSR